jgi:hypothetical protein
MFCFTQHHGIQAGQSLHPGANKSARVVSPDAFWIGISRKDEWVWTAELDGSGEVVLSAPRRINDMPEWRDVAIARDAIKHDPHNIRFINRPSAALQRIAVMQDPTTFSYIADQDPEVQSDAVFENPGALVYIRQLSEQARLRWRGIPVRRREAWCALFPVLVGV